MRRDVALGGLPEGHAGVDFCGKARPRPPRVLNRVDTLGQLRPGSASRLPGIGQRDGRIGAEAKVPPLACHLTAQHPAARAVHRDVEDQAAHAAHVVGAAAPNGGHLRRAQLFAGFPGRHDFTPGAFQPGGS